MILFALHQHIIPLETTLANTLASIKQSHQLRKLYQKIRGCFSQTKDFYIQARNNELKNKEDSLELIFDQCDIIADELDNLDGLGISINLLEPHYEKLVNYISEIQEQVDSFQQEEVLF